MPTSAASSEPRDVGVLASEAVTSVRAIQMDKGVTMLYAIDVAHGSKTQRVRYFRAASSLCVDLFQPLQIVEVGLEKLPGPGKGHGIDRDDCERLFQLLAAEQVFGELLKRNGAGYINAYVTLGSKAGCVLAGKLLLRTGFTKTRGGKNEKDAVGATVPAVAPPLAACGTIVSESHDYSE